MTERRLPIELIPQSAWHQNVRSCVHGDSWKQIARRVYEAAGHRCRICRAEGRLEAHERWRFDDITGVQHLVGIDALCGACHGACHFGRSMALGRTQLALQHYASINRLSPAEAFADVTAALQANEGRSKRTWRLDLRLLTTRFGIRLSPSGREEGVL